MGPTWVLTAPDGPHVACWPHEPCYQGSLIPRLFDALPGYQHGIEYIEYMISVAMDFIHLRHLIGKESLSNDEFQYLIYK